MDKRVEHFLHSLKGKRIALLGIGTSHLPLIALFSKYGAVVTACDKRTREQLGENAEIAEKNGATLKLGDGYLSDTNYDIVFRTPGMRYYMPELVRMRELGIVVTSEMELFFDLCPCKIYGITGSDGKTTTTTIISEMLKRHGKTVHIGGNIGKPLLPIIETIDYDDVAVVEDLKYLTPDEFQKVGVFIDSYNNLRSNFFGYEVEEKILNSYEGLSESYRNALRQSLLNCINESAISATQLGEVSPFILRYQLDHLGSWILESTKLQIKSLVNERFSKLDDLEELREAYKADYITEQQYDSRYKEITSDYEVRQFLKELSDYKIDDAPIDIQWYVVSNIVRQLGYKSLGEYRYCQDFVYDIRSLLKYLASYGNVKDIVLKKAEEEICSVLSDDESTEDA